MGPCFFFVVCTNAIVCLCKQDIVIEGDGQPGSVLQKEDANGKQGQGMKGHGSHSPPNGKVGTVIGIIANGFSGMQHNGANGHTMTGMHNGYAPQGCVLSRIISTR